MRNPWTTMALGFGLTAAACRLDLPSLPAPLAPRAPEALAEECIELAQQGEAGAALDDRGRRVCTRAAEAARENYDRLLEEPGTTLSLALLAAVSDGVIEAELIPKAEQPGVCAGAALALEADPDEAHEALLQSYCSSNPEAP